MADFSQVKNQVKQKFHHYFPRAPDISLLIYYRINPCKDSSVKIQATHGHLLCVTELSDVGVRRIIATELVENCLEGSLPWLQSSLEQSLLPVAHHQLSRITAYLL